MLGYALLAATMGLALLTVLTKSLFRATLLFALVNVCVAGLMYLAGAPYVAAFQLLVYAGAVTVLMLAVVYFVEEREEVGARWAVLAAAPALALAALLLRFVPTVQDWVRPPLPGALRSGFLWEYRGLDVLAQAFMLLATLVAVAGVMRGVRDGGGGG